MEIFGPLIISTIAGLSTTLGALIIFLKVKSENIQKFITFCLSFSIAIMICISITDLIPNSVYSLTQNNFLSGIILAILAFCSGFILIKFFIAKIEKCKKEQNSLYKLGILSMVALMLHNFPEGCVQYVSH